MKLKEKFTTMILDKDIADWEKECVKLTDEFAVGFAEWIGQNEFTMFSNGIWYSGLGTAYSEKELLVIYKQEKGL